MTRLISILCLICLASCASKPPRAILPPPSVIAELDVGSVAEATTRTRDAVREVAAAGRESREVSRKLSDTSVRLRAAIDALAGISTGYVPGVVDLSPCTNFS